MVPIVVRIGLYGPLIQRFRGGLHPIVRRPQTSVTVGEKTVSLSGFPGPGGSVTWNQDPGTRGIIG